MCFCEQLHFAHTFSKYLLYAADFVMFAQTQVGKNLHLLTAAISDGNRFLPTSRHTCFRFRWVRIFSNLNFNTRLHGHQGYIIPLWHIWWTNKSHKFSQCVIVGTTKHDSTFWLLWHIPVFIIFLFLYLIATTSYCYDQGASVRAQFSSWWL